MKTAYVQSFNACKSSLLDTRWFKDFFVENGWGLTDDVASADAILLNTCAYKKCAEDQCISRIEEVKRLKKTNAVLVVCGCLPGINIERLRGIYDGPVFTPEDVKRLDDIVNPIKSIMDVEYPHNFVDDVCRMRSNPYQNMSRVEFIKQLAYSLMRRQYYRAYEILFEFLNSPSSYVLFEEYLIKIQDGCLGNCSYCAIRKARGSSKSRPIEAVKREFGLGVRRGFKRICLYGDDIGAYGLDFGSDLCKLLEELHGVEGEYELMLFYLNPRWYEAYYPRIRGIIGMGRITNILFAVDSGSDTVLERMNRRYKASEFKKHIIELRRCFPHMDVYACFIAGFPGETDEEFRETEKFISEVNLNGRVFLNEYSARPNTPAASLPGQIPEELKHDRLNRLSRLIMLQLLKNKLKSFFK